MKFHLVPYDYLGERCVNQVPDPKKPGKVRKRANRASIELNSDALTNLSPGGTHMICKDCAVSLFFVYMDAVRARELSRFARPKGAKK